MPLPRLGCGTLVRNRMPAQRRKKTGVRKRTIAIKSLTKNKIEAGWIAIGGRPKNQTLGVLRPQTVGDCFGDGHNRVRPCPWVSCKHHNYLDVDPDTGSIILNFPDLEPWEISHTCSLDVAALGGVTLDEVGLIMNLTRERIRQIEIRALTRKVYPALKALGLGTEE